MRKILCRAEKQKKKARGSFLITECRERKTGRIVEIRKLKDKDTIKDR